MRIIKTAQEIAKSSRGVAKEVDELDSILVDFDAALASIQDNADDRDDETLQRLVDNCLHLSPQVFR